MPVGADAGATEGSPTARTGRGSRRRPPAYVAAVVAIVVAAGILRAIGLGSGLPYTSYIDEGFVLKPAADMAADHTWDPGWYNYPSLLIELTAVGVTGVDVVTDGVGADVSDTARSAGYNDVAPAALILTARLLVWFFATATVLVTIVLGSRLAGRRVGLVAGVLVAVAPALVTRSAVVIVDTPATFFVAATMLAASYLARSRRPIVVAAIAGALAGLAATSKYPSATVILVVWAVVAMTASFDLRRKFVLGATSAVAAVVAAVVTMPALILRTSLVSESLRRQAEIYADKATDTGYLQDSLSGTELGWWLVVPAVVGLVLLVRDRRARPVTVGWLLATGALAFAVSRSNFQPFRNVLPLVPFLTIAAATTVVAAVRLVRGLLPADRRSTGGAASVGLTAALTLALVIAMFAAGVQPYLDTRAHIVDSRTQAVDWLAGATRPGQRVLVARELAMVESELGRIPAKVTVADTVGDVDVDWGDFDYVVVGGFKDVAPPVELAGSDVVASFGVSRMSAAPNLWRTSNQIVEVRDPA